MNTENDTSPQIPEFYTNNIGINVNPSEVELRNLLVDSDANIKGAINLRMSPQTAWILFKSLGRQIDQYEKDFGKIPLPGGRSQRAAVR